MLGFKIKYRTVERGHPRKIVLVPVYRPDQAPEAVVLNKVDEVVLDGLQGAREAPSRLH